MSLFDNVEQKPASKARRYAELHGIDASAQQGAQAQVLALRKKREDLYDEMEQGVGGPVRDRLFPSANRDDPAIMVGARFGVGFTFNVANPMAWLVIAGIVAVPAGLVAIGAAAGM